MRVYYPVPLAAGSGIIDSRPSAATRPVCASDWRAATAPARVQQLDLLHLLQFRAQPF